VKQLKLSLLRWERKNDLKKQGIGAWDKGLGERIIRMMLDTGF